MTLRTTNACRSLRAGTGYRRCRLWRVVLRSGAVLRLTDHNRTVPFQGEDFLAPKGGESSDRRREAALKPGNQEFRLIVSDLITVEDLAAGLYDNARVDEWVVDWRYPFLGAFSSTVYFLSSTSFSGETLRAEATTAVEIYQNRIGQTVEPDCAWDLGRPGCNVNMQTDRPWGGGTSGSSIAAKYVGIVVASVPSAISFTVSALTAQLDNRTYSDGSVDRIFQFGRVRWTTGLNANTEGNIVGFTYGATSTFILADRPGRTMEEGDTCELYAGCDRRRITCKEKWDNLDQFRGFEFVPKGADVIDPP